MRTATFWTLSKRFEGSCDCCVFSGKTIVAEKHGGDGNSNCWTIATKNDGFLALDEGVNEFSANDFGVTGEGLERSKLEEVFEIVAGAVHVTVGMTCQDDGADTVVFGEVVEGKGDGFVHVICDGVLLSWSAESDLNNVWVARNTGVVEAFASWEFGVVCGK